MYRIEVARDQNSRFTLPGMRKPRPHTAAKSLPACDPFDRRTHDRHVARGNVEHALDSRGIPGRALALHPGAKAGQHGLGIKGKVGGVHGFFSSFEGRPFSSLRE
jgi:hypothetical protein